MVIQILQAVNWFILWYLILFSFLYIIILMAAIPDVLFYFSESHLPYIVQVLKSKIMPPVTVIISAYNEIENIIFTIDSILISDYSQIEIIVVNDGSTDHTLSQLISHYDLYAVMPVIPKKIKSASRITGYYLSRKIKNLTVIDKLHTDKSDSLNVGLNACQTPLFITVDADTLIIEKEAISQIVYNLLSQPHTVAIGGALYILNGCDYQSGKILQAKMSYNPVCAIQICEYLRSFLFSRSGWNLFGGALCYSGAFTLFERQAVLDVGGFDVGNFANDFEIITHLQANAYGKKQPCRVGFTTSAVAWTDVPATLIAYWRQRTKWQVGSLRSLMLYKHMLFNPRYGIVGLVTYPYYLFGEMLGCIVELAAYLSIVVSWIMGVLNVYWTVLFFLLCFGLNAFITLTTVLISFITYNRYKRLRDLFWIMLLVILEQFGFRQFHVVCRVVATIKYFITGKAT